MWQGPFQFGESHSQTAAGTPPAFPANYNNPTGLLRVLSNLPALPQALVGPRLGPPHPNAQAAAVPPSHPSTHSTSR